MSIEGHKLKSIFGGCSYGWPQNLYILQIRCIRSCVGIPRYTLTLTLFGELMKMENLKLALKDLWTRVELAWGYNITAKLSAAKQYITERELAIFFITLAGAFLTAFFAKWYPGLRPVCVFLAVCFFVHLCVFGFRN